VKKKGVLLLYIPSNIETKRQPFGGMLAMPWLFFSLLFSSSDNEGDREVEKRL
jgi:hypothetical protein